MPLSCTARQVRPTPRRLAVPDGVEPGPPDRSRHSDLLETDHQLLAPGYRASHGGQRQGCGVTLYAVPYLRNPQGVGISRVLRNHVAHAPGHVTRASSQYLDHLLALARGDRQLHDQAIHVPAPITTLLEGLQRRSAPPPRAIPGARPCPPGSTSAAPDRRPYTRPAPRWNPRTTRT